MGTMKQKIIIMMVLLLGMAGMVFIWQVRSTHVQIDGYTSIDQLATIRPDYSGVVIPPNIAPLNFRITQPAKRYFVKIASSNGNPIEIVSATGKIQIPLKKWRKILRDNAGETLRYEIFLQDEGGKWIKYQPIQNLVARDAIDSHLVYRRMRPLYNYWRDIGIYQRNLTDFNEEPILQGKSFEEGCVNCHTFRNNDPESMFIGIRSSRYGSCTILASGDSAEKIGAKWGYTSWHPSGKMAVFSLNKVRQFFHETGVEIRDVVDLDSALAFYELSDRRQIRSSPVFLEIDRLESYPHWAPDGKTLYFCSGPVLWEDRDTVPPENFNKVKYDLMQVSYDVATGTWGQAELVLSSRKTEKSILLPRTSPDGRFLVFCMCDYGCFPVFQPSSDLYMMDCQTKEYRKLEINSKYSESWHCFSSNSRWMVFSSKRRDGLFTRPYISYVDESGKVHKPFILPQKDPCYYDGLLQTLSVPELVTGRVNVSQKAMVGAIRSKDRNKLALPVSGATRKAHPSDVPERE